MSSRPSPFTFHHELQARRRIRRSHHLEKPLVELEGAIRPQVHRRSRHDIFVLDMCGAGRVYKSPFPAGRFDKGLAPAAVA